MGTVVVCDVGRCKQLPVMQYAAFGPRRNKVVDVCDKHWELHCDEVDKFDLRTYFYPKDGCK